MKELITSCNNDELAKQSGMVYQVWEDGEITLQKSGDLLWRRTLHSIHYGMSDKAIPIEDFPHKSGSHGFAYVNEADALCIRETIFNQ